MHVQRVNHQRGFSVLLSFCSEQRRVMVCSRVHLDRSSHHQVDQLMRNLSCRQRRGLSIRIIHRRNLHHVSANNIQALQASEDGKQLPGRPPTSFGRSGSCNKRQLACIGARA